MKPLKSDIPARATERLLRRGKRKGAFTELRVMECVFRRRVVGRRYYTREGKLAIETPLRNGKKHGREFTWDEDGRLELIEPYSIGKGHGTAKQFGRDGRVIGTYKLVHGTGLDVWRVQFGGRVYVSEIHSLRDGVPDGCELWFNTGSKIPTLYHERYWREGELHGIERMWNSRGRLSRGYPKYFVWGRKVSRRKYVSVASTDKTLLPFRKKDNLPRRNFAPNIERILFRQAPDRLAHKKLLADSKVAQAYMTPRQS